VSHGLDPQRRALDACYQQAVRQAPLAPPRGAGAFSFAINEDGLVMAGRSVAEGAAGALRGCLEQVLLRSRFPRPEIGPVLVTLSLNLEPQP
jgi:hypothetical protein